MLRNFLEKKVSGFKPIAYVVSKLQILLILLFLTPSFKFFVADFFVYAIAVIVFFSYLYVLFFELRSGVAKDEYLVYFVFFFSVASAGVLSLAIPLFLGGYSVYSFLVPVAVVVCAFAALFAFRRNYAPAVAASSGKGSVVVEKDFDIFSLTNAGKFAVESERQVKTGEKVKVSVKSTFSGRKPSKII